MPPLSLNVCISPCPNDTFAFGNIVLGNIRSDHFELNYEYEDIQTLNQLGLSDSPPDILKFSYGAWPRLKQKYRLLRVGSALGHGAGPLIVGKKGIPLEDRTVLLIPGLDTTACLLVKRYFPNATLKEISYDKILPALEKDEKAAGVIIHESRFTYHQHDLELLFDLGSHWEEDTKGPLPLGGVAILKKHGDERALLFENLLQDSINLAWKKPESTLEFMQKHAQEMEPEVMQQHVDLYVNQDTHQLSEKGIQAIETLCGLKGEGLW